MRTRIQKLRSLLADRLVFFAVLILAGCLFTLIYLVLNGNTRQVYTDIVTGYPTLYGSNISADHSLFYILSVLGAALYGVYFLGTKQAARDGAARLERLPENHSNLELIISILVLAGTCYLVYTKTHPLIILCLLLLLLLSTVDRSVSPLGLTFLCLGSYAVISLYRIYIYLGGAAAQLQQTTDPEQLADIIASTEVSLYAVIVPVFALAVFFALHRDRRTHFIRGILVAQCFVPFLLLIYLASDYLYNNYYTKIDPPRKQFC